jgi:hypothetical protein
MRAIEEAEGRQHNALFHRRHQKALYPNVHSINIKR